MRIPAFLLAIGLTSTGFAGAYLETTTGDPATKQPRQVNKMWFDGGRMRTENGERGEGAVAIFKDQAMYVLDPANKSYRKIDKATVDQMAAKLAEARKQMQAAMANMPPERRAMMEKMMGQLGGAANDGAKRTLKKTSRKETVAGIECTVWEASVGGEKVEELCAAPAASVTGGAEMMKTMREVGEMLKGFTKSFGAGSQIDGNWRDMETLNGVPVLTRDFSGGKVTSETRLAVARKESIPADRFEVPAGYTEKKISFGPGSGEDE
ncbi:MAG TPA: DUF4412 domain-containing protein [Steroidobacteraceae bacterium]|jgi:hypothetical protein|nr:DUF4412 domain-containing protein [Steroidobacteraceae bacterium]